jgi:uncharacterized protein with NRDE domain
LIVCIVVFRWQPDSDSPLILAANRDEFFARPTAALHWWDDAEILAGRDLKGGGTWMGVTREGRFALVTNVRDPRLRKANAPSRGMIVNEFLEGRVSAQAFLATLALRASIYEGFNVVCGSLASRSTHSRELWFLNSVEAQPRRLNDGTYTLSNASLDTPWPKTMRIKEHFANALDHSKFDVRAEAIDTLLLDDTPADEAALPDTGVPREWERALGSIFIQHRDDAGKLVYGTRSSSQLHATNSTVKVRETTHLDLVRSHSRVSFDFNI